MNNMNEMVGRQVKVILLDDPYLGRVGRVEAESKYSIIVRFKDKTKRIYELGNVVFMN